MARNELIAILANLEEHQIAQLQEQAERFLHINKELNDTKPHSCPCCKVTTANFIKKGFSGRKQRYQCKECGKKFTYDAGKLTAFSHHTKYAWETFIEDTLSFCSIDKCAEHIGVCHVTAFYMRQKLLAFLEKVVLQSEMLDGIIEADETYVQESQKGKAVTHRKARKHGETATKRGLSSEQICICVASDREGHLTANCVNRAKPSSEDIEKAIGEKISEGCVFQCDGATAYNRLIENKKCTQIVLKGHADYGKVYHLNTVNGLHNRLKELLRKYRGVSTKYLNRYLALFAAMEMVSTFVSKAEGIRIRLAQVQAVLSIQDVMNEGLLAI